MATSEPERVRAAAQYLTWMIDNRERVVEAAGAREIGSFLATLSDLRERVARGERTLLDLAAAVEHFRARMRPERPVRTRGVPEHKAREAVHKAWEFEATDASAAQIINIVPKLEDAYRDLSPEHADDRRERPRP